ncbi:MAG: extracellular solute-binding protein [Subtercola sp.]|nr:extracellular solute-binding protein [Subtercola sp.]
MRMRRTRTLVVAAAVAAALSLAGCSSSGSTSGGSENLADANTALGDASVVAAMDQLYKDAIAAGQTTITVYGPGETAKQQIYDNVFSKRYPQIKVTGVQAAGPDFAAKLTAEAASGQHIADLVQAGDTSIVPAIKNGWIDPFTPVNVAGRVDAAKFSDPTNAVWAASSSTFGYLYNTDKMKEADAPKGWLDLTNPKYQGLMTNEPVNKAGASFGALTQLLYAGVIDSTWLSKLQGQNIAFQNDAATAANSVATGEHSLVPFYTMDNYLLLKATGAPVGFVFPTQDGVHLSSHYLGLVKGSKNPIAAKLLETWLFTPEAQQAAADIGYYPSVNGEPGPQGQPSVDKLDLLKSYSLADLTAMNTKNLAAVKVAFP